MISRSGVGRNAQLALRRQCCAKPAPSNRRGLAAVSTGSTSFSYETADAGGVKVASRDVAGPTTSLAVVAKAGTRYQPLPGLTVGLERFAFKVCILPQGTILAHILKTDAPTLFIEYPPAICSPNHKRIRASWRSIACVPYKRVLSPRGKISPGRPPILHGVAWRGSLPDEIHS